MKRSGFTMIELIFVIVILGILAAVAIPKLAATREDAKIASEMTNVSQAIQNLGAEYASQGTIAATSITEANTASKCFTIAAVAGEDGNITVTSAAKDATVCPSAVLTATKAKAVANGVLNSDGTAKKYVFGGIGVK